MGFALFRRTGKKKYNLKTIFEVLCYLEWVKLRDVVPSPPLGFIAFVLILQSIR